MKRGKNSPLCRGGSLISTLAALALIAAPVPAAAEPPVVVVSSTIQAAIDSAAPGDTVFVPSGVYRETVRVDKNNIAIYASPGAILDGTGIAGRVSGITVSAQGDGARIDGFTLIGMQIQNFTRNGVQLIRVDNFQISGGRYIDNETYGVYPIFSSRGLVDRNDVSGSNDAGIYVGQSSDIVIAKNHTRDNTAGIEITNCARIAAIENTLIDNSMGFLIGVLPGRTVSTATSSVQVIDNSVMRNNRQNPVTDPADVLSLLPSGLGILNVGGDSVIIRNNTVTLNNSAGIAVIRLPPELASLDSRVDPFPDEGVIRDNVLALNGTRPDARLGSRPPVDLLWDTMGAGTCWSGNFRGSQFPSLLPPCE
jgi:parallel beta-helix repeat protein